jgi:hypothetical protein
MSKLEEFYKIFKPDKITGISRIVKREELKGTLLDFGVNGNGRPSPGGIKYFNINNYYWDVCRAGNGDSGKLLSFQTTGYDYTEKYSRNIRKDIKKNLLSKYTCCIICGSGSNLRVDHKNGYYNNPKALMKETQEEEDFQVLCNGCNLKKRSWNKKEMELEKRIPATSIPLLEFFGIDFIEGDETLDSSNPDACKGTYYYDPIEFIKYCKNKIIDETKLDIIRKIQIL